MWKASDENIVYSYFKNCTLPTETQSYIEHHCGENLVVCNNSFRNNNSNNNWEANKSNEKINQLIQLDESKTYLFYTQMTKKKEKEHVLPFLAKNKSNSHSFFEISLSQTLRALS